jgi:hypothetical protein
MTLIIQPIFMEFKLTGELCAYIGYNEYLASGLVADT